MLTTRTARLLMPVALLLAFAGCAKTPSVDKKADSADLLAAADSFTKAYNDKNADVVAALYSDDAQLLPPNAPAINGRAAIKQHYTDELTNNFMPLKITTGESAIAGNWGWRSGTWSVDTSPTMTGKFVEVWRRSPAGWVMYRDIWNSDAPMPSQPPATPAAATAPQ